MNRETAISAVIADWRKRPFVWAKHDCCRFAADVVMATGAPDPMNGLRSYKSKTGALRLLTDKPLESYLDERFERVELAFARRGDLVMANGNVGVVWDRGALFVGEDGLNTIPRREWTGAWRNG